MIYTITFNPSLDYLITSNLPISMGKINRASDYQFKVGGKGINVSLLLANFGIKSKAITFLGGFVGQEIQKQLSSIAEIELDVVSIEQNSRINVKLCGEEETALNLAGPVVSETNVNDLIRKLYQLDNQDYVVISGSYCQGIDYQTIKCISDIVHEKKARLVIDCPNITLNQYQKLHPYLIKPNLEELSAILKKEVKVDELQSAINELLENSIENVVVSLGELGSYYSDGIVSYQATGPTLDVKTTVGCGDAMLTGLIISLLRSQDFNQALVFAEATGRAKAQSFDMPTVIEVEEMIKQITIKTLKK